MKMPENTKTKDQKLKTKDQLIWLFFALLIIFVYFFGLTIPLVGPDEPRYSQIAREMFERGDWVTPQLGGFDWFEKPALLYWLQIISYKIFGVTEFAARFGSAIFGLGTVFSLWLLAKFQGSRFKIQDSKTKDKGQRTKDELANWLAVIAASSIGLIAFSRGASFDIILTFPITAALAAFFIFDQKEEKSGFALYFLLAAFYFFIGVALLAKGLVGIVFPLAIVAFYYVVSWKLPHKKFIFSTIWGTILSLLVAAVWYVPVYQINGWKFIDEFIIKHHFRRFTSDVYQHHQPFWFFFAVLPLMTLPWLPFFFASFYRQVSGFRFQVSNSRFENKEQRTKDKKQNSDSRFAINDLRRFAFAWLLVPLVFFSFSGSKLPGLYSARVAGYADFNGDLCRQLYR